MAQALGLILSFDDVIDVAGADTYQHDCGLGHLLRPNAGKHLDGPVTTVVRVLGVACEILGWAGMGHVASSSRICAWTG